MPAFFPTFTLLSLCIVATQAFYFNPGVRLYDLYRRASVRMPVAPFAALSPYNDEDDVIPVYLDTDAADPATTVIVEEVDGSDDDTVPMPKRSLNKIMRKYTHMRPRLVPF